MNRIKVLACTLTVGVGGLAVFATPGDKPTTEPAPLPTLTVKPTSPNNGAETSGPKPAKSETFDIPIPDIDLPIPGGAIKSDPKKTVELDLPVPGAAPAVKVTAGPELPSIPTPEKPKGEVPQPKPVLIIAPPSKTAPVLEDITPPAKVEVIPAKAETPVTPMVPPLPEIVPAKAEVPLSPPPLPEIVPASGDTKKPAPTPIIIAPESPKPTKEPELKKPEPIAPPAKVSKELLPPLDAAPSVVPEKLAPPAVSVTVPASPKPDETMSPRPSTDTNSALKMLVRMGDGRPRFEIRNKASEEVLLKVYGEKIEMQPSVDNKSSLAGVSALGQVRFTAPGIEGTCDHLTILSSTGEVMLKGNIHLKTKRGKTWSEMTAEKMVYQIGSMGLAGSKVPAVPTKFVRD
jgi:hypothetical protein